MIDPCQQPKTFIRVQKPSFEITRVDVETTGNIRMMA